MASLLGRLGFRKRQNTRVTVHWMADVKIPDSDSFIGFQTVDLSCTGVCLWAQTSEMLERVRRGEESVPMRLRLPAPHGQIEFEAQLSWEREVEGKPLCGWAFTKIHRKARDAITAYIEAHPEAVVQEPDQEGQEPSDR